MFINRKQTLKKCKPENVNSKKKIWENIEIKHIKWLFSMEAFTQLKKIVSKESLKSYSKWQRSLVATNIQNLLQLFQ